MIKNKVFEMLNIQRGSTPMEEMDASTAPFLLLGYCAANNEILKVNIDNILSSNNIKEAVREALNTIGEQVILLREPLKYLNNLKLSSEEIAKILVILKSACWKEEQYTDAMEYLLEQVSDVVGRTKGEDDTPKCINQLGIHILEPKGTFYDGTLGLAGGAVEAYQQASQVGNVLKMYGQEINLRAYALACVRVFMHGIRDAQLKKEDMLTTPMLEEGGVKKFDSIMMNPPFSLAWREQEKQIANDKYARYIYGLPSASSADWLFISAALKALSKKGKAIIITTLGALFRAGAEENLRKKIMGFDWIETIIELPAGLFNHTNIPCAMIVFNMDKADTMKDKIQFINADNLYESVRRGKRVLTNEHINTIVKSYKDKSHVEDISTVVTLEDIDNGNLLPSRYVVKTEFDSTSYGKVKIHVDKLDATSTLGDVGNFYRGINVTSKNVQDAKGNYKIINIADINEGKVDIEAVPLYKIENNARVESYKVEPGDIIISNRGATKICIIPEHEGDVLISQNFIGIRPKSGYNAAYIKMFLESPIGEYLIDSRKTGTAVATINPKDLKKLPLVAISGQNQDAIMEDYGKEEQKLEEELTILQAKIDNMKMELYDKMGIKEVFERI